MNPHFDQGEHIMSDPIVVREKSIAQSRFTSVNMSGSEFNDVNLSNSVFYNVNLREAKIGGIDFGGAEFSCMNTGEGKSRQPAKFTDMEFDNCSFKGGSFAGAAITGTNLVGMTINGISVLEMIKQYGNLKEKRMAEQSDSLISDSIEGGMSKRDPKLIALLFNECINNQDLEGLARLMHDEHAFVDRDGGVHQPKQAMIDSWREFFKLFPDYKNTFTRVESASDIVVILGYAYWSVHNPCDRVIWRAVIIDDLIREWRIYSDTPEDRKLFHLD